MSGPGPEALPLQDISGFRLSLGSWYDRENVLHPWTDTRDPYEILVSEVMLQQTRVATVIGRNYYTRFLEKFPNPAALAKADDRSLLKAWEGLGYYRRARMLRATAVALIDNHNGEFPRDPSDLLALPGIGPYTAAALVSFAFGRVSDLVDGNVSRVLSRLMNDPSPIDSSRTIALHRRWSLALCDPRHPRRHHHAMMRLGQTICRPGPPACHICPVSHFCSAVSPGNLPVRSPRPAITPITEHAIWSRDTRGRILLHQETGSRRTGLWKLPLRSPEECARFPVSSTSSYHITRYKVTLKVHPAAPDTITLGTGDHWKTIPEIESLPLPAPFKKVIKQLSSDL